MRRVVACAVALIAWGCARPASDATPSSPDSVAAVDTAGGGVGTSAPDRGGSLAAPDDSTSTAAAADVIRRYYAAIDARDFQAAYAAWADSGKASQQTGASFAAGFARTRTVEADVGPPGRLDAAAGSRYVEVPVTVRAVLDDGTRQLFTGRYVLRRSEVDGATGEQRRWHIVDATIVAARVVQAK